MNDFSYGAEVRFKHMIDDKVRQCYGQVVKRIDGAKCVAAWWLDKGDRTKLLVPMDSIKTKMQKWQR